MNFKGKYILLIFLLASLISISQNKLYYFSGSDWCAPCIKLKKNVIEKEEFKKLIKSSKIDFEILDFPQRKKGLTKRYQKHCDSLAALYNKEGSFPKLLSVKGEVVKVINHNQPLNLILNEIKKEFKEVGYCRDYKNLMGSNFSITILNTEVDTSLLFKQSWNIVRAIESEISSWDSTSITALVNRSSGVKPVKVPFDYFKLVEYSKTISETTQGAFDITVKPALQIWDWRKGVIPSNELIDSIRPLVGYQNIILSKADTSVFLTRKGMKLDFGAIGKGYAADKVVEFLKFNYNIPLANVDAGGDFVKLNEEGGLKVHIPNPNSPDSMLYQINVPGKAVVTSGDYFRKFEKDGKRYSHILDPKTIRPTRSGNSSVTVIAPNGTLADALATALSVMGAEAGINLVNQLPGVEAIILNVDGREFLSANVLLE